MNESLRVLMIDLLTRNREMVHILDNGVNGKKLQNGIDHDEVFHREKIMFGDLLKLDAPVKLYE